MESDKAEPSPSAPGELAIPADEATRPRLHTITDVDEQEEAVSSLC